MAIGSYIDSSSASREEREGENSLMFLCYKCCYNRIRNDAKRWGMELKEISGEGAREVTVHMGPPGFAPSEATFKAWFMAIPEVCICGGEVPCTTGASV